MPSERKRLAGTAGTLMENRNSMVAAAVIMVVFGVTFYYLPAIMLAVGQVSTIAAALVVVLFLFGMFIVFWLRGRYQRRRED